MENEMNLQIEDELRENYAKLFNFGACVILDFLVAIALTVFVGDYKSFLISLLVTTPMISSFYLMKKMFQLFDLWGSVVMTIVLVCASYSKIAGYAFGISMLLLNLYLAYEFIFLPLKNLRLIRKEYDTWLTFNFAEILINVARAILDKIVAIIQITINYIISIFKFVIWPFTILVALFV